LPSRPSNRSGSRSASICARQPRGQQPCRFVRGPSVEWHERASGSGDPHDVGSPAVWRNRRNLDDIRPSRDGLFEAMHDVGHQSRCDIILLLGASFSPATRRVSSEGTHEGAANASASLLRPTASPSTSPRNTCGRVWSTRRADGSRTSAVTTRPRPTPAGRAGGPCRRRADHEHASGIRVRHETWTANRRAEVLRARPIESAAA
jgi:hypothetical protein